MFFHLSDSIKMADFTSRSQPPIQVDWVAGSYFSATKLVGYSFTFEALSFQPPNVCMKTYLLSMNPSAQHTSKTGQNNSTGILENIKCTLLISKY